MTDVGIEWAHFDMEIAGSLVNLRENHLFSKNLGEIALCHIPAKKQ